MKKLFQRIGQANLSSSEENNISKILSKIDEHSVDAWIETINFQNGWVRSTFYRDIGSKRPFNYFIEIYQCLGYDFKILKNWKDWKFDHGGYVREDAWSCNTGTCT